MRYLIITIPEPPEPPTRLAANCRCDPQPPPPVLITPLPGVPTSTAVFVSVFPPPPYAVQAG